MKCFEEGFYSEFLDDELKPEEKKRALVHLEECEKCRNTVKQLKEENVKIKELFETDLHNTDLVPSVMNKIIIPEYRSFEGKKFWPFLVYGIFILIGILTPYFLLSYFKSTALFENILSPVFTPFSLVLSLVSFLLREILFITSGELNEIVIGQVLVIILFVMIFNAYFIKQKKTLKEDY